MIPPAPSRTGTARTAEAGGHAAQARACWLVAPGHAELRYESLDRVGPDHVLVHNLHSGISRGTETTVFRGEVPPGEYARMRAPFQAGEFPGPVKYGYSSVGRVEDGPADLLGRTVFCLYPHQSRYVVPVQAVHPVPDGVPAARAALAANMETAVNALWDAGPRIGDRIAVVGAGVLGLLVAWLAARLPGCKVEVVDILPARAAVAIALGLDFALPGQATPDADLVVHASGHSAGLSTAMQLAGMESTVLELSWYGSRPVTVALGEAFHARRLRLQSSQVGQVAASQRSRWNHRRRLALALSLLADPALDVLVSRHVPFADLPSVLARMSSATPDDDLCVCIDYP